MIYTSSLVRWMQRKRYQYEVTFSLYMLTPTEKFIFSKFSPLPQSFSLEKPNKTPSSPSPPSPPFPEGGIRGVGFFFKKKIDSFLFLVLSMIVIAASLYLPEHVTMMARRAWFYYAGDESGRDAGVGSGYGYGNGNGAQGVGAAGVGGKGVGVVGEPGMGAGGVGAGAGAGVGRGEEVLDFLGRL